MRRASFILLVSAAWWAQPARAADALKFGPPPAWVQQQPIPPTKSSDAPVVLLLNDQQIAFDKGKITTYSEVAFKIQNPQGLDAGNLSISWAPETDVVTVNKLQIRRGDKIIDVLGAGQTFTVLRRETNLDAAMLDGTLTANIQPEGLQEGDIVDLVTTIEHSDPVLKGHVEAAFGGWNGTPLQSGHVLLSWPSGTKINVRQSEGLPAGRRTVRDGRTVVEISGSGIEPLIPPKGAPIRFAVGRLGEASDFTSWAQLAQLMSPLYSEAAKVPASGPLRDEVEKIRAASSNPKARAEQALQLVQDRVRYVALLMGQGGYMPASAEQTWSRRFGDCKGKTVLLLALLHELGIEAEPILVNTSLGDVIGDRLPILELFDHVLVRAHIGGNDYWLDGTRTGDTDLAAIEIPDFGWGLPIIANAELVHLVPRPLRLPASELNLDIDARTGVYTTASATADQVIRGDLAVALQSRLTSFSVAQRDEFFRAYWTNAIDFVTVKSSGSAFDKAKRELRLTMKGDAKLDWSSGYFHVPDSTVGYHPDFDRQQARLQDAPFAVNYPSYNKWVVHLRLPPGFLDGRRLGSADVHETLAGIAYERVSTVAGDMLTVETSSRSLVPEVSYKDAKAAEARLIALDDEDIALPLQRGYRATEADLDAMQKDEPADAAGFVSRGNTLLDAGKFDDAIADFTKALSLDPKDVLALADRAIAYAWQRKGDLADKDIAAALAIEPGSAVALRARALRAEINQDCAAAVENYAKALKSEADNGFAIGHKAICEAILHRNADALADADMALAQSPQWSQLRFLKIDLLAREGRKDEAVREAAIIAKDFGEGASAQWVTTARFFAQHAMRAEAVDAIDRAIAIKAEPNLYVTRSELRPISDYAARMSDIDLALKLDPLDIAAVTAKADLIASRGDLQEAVATYDSAIKKRPGISPFTLNRAILLYQLGRKTEAERAISDWRRLAGTASELTELCRRKVAAGILLESAEKDCNDALHVNSDSTEAMENLALVKLRRGKLDDAIAEYDRVIDKTDKASSYMGRAIAYARKGDQTRAEADRTQALNRDASVEAQFAQYGLEFLDQTKGKATAAAH